tara:strand:- start:464 stop:646 length:183 start_codon:yes stop_codon:yes gene_type:complete
MAGAQNLVATDSVKNISHPKKTRAKKWTCMAGAQNLHERGAQKPECQKSILRTKSDLIFD